MQMRIVPIRNVIMNGVAKIVAQSDLNMSEFLKESQLFIIFNYLWECFKNPR